MSPERTAFTPYTETNRFNREDYHLPAPEIKKVINDEKDDQGENFANAKLDHKTSRLLLKIFTRNATENPTVPAWFQNYYNQNIHNPFLKKYLAENPDSQSRDQLAATDTLQAVESYRVNKNYEYYYDDPFFIYLVSDRFAKELHYLWQQTKEFQERYDDPSQLTDTNNFAASNEQVLRTFGKVLSEARSRYESYANSHIDKGTGLLNRSTFEHYFTYLQNPNIQKEQLRGHLHGFAFVMIDLDHFKSINDNYGHIVGDRALAQLAQAFKDNPDSREEDAFFRYGGDEFSFIAPISNENSSQNLNDETVQKQIFERILKVLRPISEKMQHFPVNNRRFINITLSTGINITPMDKIANIDPQDSQATIRRIVDDADSALYLSKTTRNSLTLQLTDGTTLNKPLVP